VLAIIKEGGFATGDVAHIVYIVKPWIEGGGGSPDLDNALRYCVSKGWLANDSGGYALTEAGAAQ
jgi:hypothetical protein